MAFGRFAFACLLAGAAVATRPAGAAESATGAYVLGLRGPAAGVTPPPGLFFSHQLYHYNGAIQGRVPLEGGLQLAGRARVRPIVNIPTLLWVTPVEIAGARLGASLTVPFGRVAVAGSLGPIFRRDAVFTLADPSVGAFLGGKLDAAAAGALHWQAGVTGFLPIGDYRRGELANVAKHRGALDVFAALTWLEPTLGLDVSNVIGVTFNRRNEATDYRTGSEFHWEWAVTKRWDNGLSAGPAGFYYRQLSGDSGVGARLGAFKGEVWAVGATLGYEFKAGAVPVTARVRAYREIETTNRLRGNAAFLSLAMPLWVPGAR